MKQINKNTERKRVRYLFFILKNKYTEPKDLNKTPMKHYLKGYKAFTKEEKPNRHGRKGVSVCLCEFIICWQRHKIAAPNSIFHNE